jgi:hypothetical protein
MADRFFIAPYDQESGVHTDVKPWLVPDTAFAELTNAYVFRGRVRKRFGSRWLSDTSLGTRLRINIGVTPGALNIPGPSPALAIGQMFSIGTDVFTIYQLGAGVATYSTNAAITCTINSVAATNTVSFAGAAAGLTVYYYPSLPVMGLLNVESTAINDESIIAFDTRFAYQYTGGWERLATGPALWSGSDSQFFWGCTWTDANASSKVFFVTNFNENETSYLRTFTPSTSTWASFRPQIDATPNYLNCARLIVPFKNRLVALNTWEGPATLASQLHYPNRCRYSQVGSPLDLVNSWRTDLPGRGNAVDAATTEAIVSCEFIRDRLIVYFERSTWELVYTGNQIYPFTWQQINTALGAESTFSIVPFDRVVLGIGNVGIHACNGANVERIDNAIPDTVFDIHNDTDGPYRVYGIRDYFVETVYWTFPDVDADSTQPYPNKVLVYNYKTGTWSFFDDSITCFGYYQPTTGITWSSTTVTWSSTTSWGGGSLQAKSRQIIAGNQEGFTFICDSEETTNSSALQISNMAIVDNVITITAINHNLRMNEYVYFEGISSVGTITTLNDTIYQVQNVTQNTFDIITDTVLTGPYRGGGLIARVSNIVIKTKEFNFYAKEGRNASILKADFLVDTTATGQIQVDCYASTNTWSLVDGGLTTGALIGTSTLDTFNYAAAAAPIPSEFPTARVWHPVYLQADGEFIQLKFYLNDDQMKSTSIRYDDFQLHAICFSAQPTSYRFQ